MNRRSVLKGLVGGVVVMALPKVVVGQNTDIVTRGVRAWKSEDESTLLSTILLAFTTNEGAKASLREFLSDPVQRVKDLGATFGRVMTYQEYEPLGDDSIAFEVTDAFSRSGRLILTRVENRIFIFLATSTVLTTVSWEIVLLRTLVDNARGVVNPSQEAFMALLPTEEDVKPFGLDVMFSETYATS